MEKTIRVQIVDAFTYKGSGGSPTGIVMDAGSLNDAQMQFIAHRVPASHTGFLIEPDENCPDVQVRFFTPKTEILNCGHGTIAAHYLRATGFLNGNEVQFFQQARGGRQKVRINHSANGIEIFVQQNEIVFNEVIPSAISRLVNALGIDAEDILEKFPPVLASPGNKRFLVGVKSFELLEALEPDIEKLKMVCDLCNSVGCFVFSPEDVESTSFMNARMFAPTIGVIEDIVNGNSSGCLGAYQLLLTETDSLYLQVKQGSRFDRPSLVQVRASKRDGRYHTEIGGHAKIAGEVFVPVYTDIL